LASYPGASHDRGFGFRAHLCTTLGDKGATIFDLLLADFYPAKDRGSPFNPRVFLSISHSLSKILRRRRCFCRN